LFRKNTGIGLDIGSRQIRLVKMAKKGDNIKIIGFGSIPVPYGAYEAGNIVDPAKIGRCLADVVNQLQLQGQEVVSAVSDQKMYTRTLIFPRMALKDLRQAAFFEATAFLPIPAKEASMDIYPLREFQDGEGKKTEIFFVAVRRSQIDNLQAVCEMAGLRLVAVEIEPLAIRRIIADESTTNVIGLLKVGASHSSLSFFQGHRLLFHRPLPLGSSAYYHPSRYGNESNELPDDIKILIEEKWKYLNMAFAREVNQAVNQFRVQQGKELVKIIMCGGGATLNGLEETLKKYLLLDVVIADSINRIVMPPSVEKLSKEKMLQLKHEFIVAMGLGAREIV
jgi:type IV pilus assembly protein PilM